MDPASRHVLGLRAHESDLMSNNDILTTAEFDAEPPHPEIISRIEACRLRFAVPKRAFRILDWGCGRGKLVLWLRELGHDAVGADIDDRPFANCSNRVSSTACVKTKIRRPKKSVNNKK
jgi:2-polyprenyl-3-methyl-5-hydroxy-6-metoxy-1,4-benzoquinol methylase